MQVLIFAKVILCEVYFSALLSHYFGHNRIYGFTEPRYGTVWDACILFTFQGELFSIRERFLSSVKSVRVARVGAAARRELITPERTAQSLGLPARPRGFTRTARPSERRGQGRRSPSGGGRSRREPQRSAEKTRGRAGSPTRATRNVPLLSQILVGHPTLP
jgi:hypothetical protein